MLRIDFLSKGNKDKKPTVYIDFEENDLQFFKDKNM